MRIEINAVFDTCNKLLQGTYRDDVTSNGESKPDVIYNGVLTKDAIASPGIGAVKTLALQLHRLEVLNARLKLGGIERTTEHLQKKVDMLRAKINDVSITVAENKDRMNQKRDEMNEAFAEAADGLALDTLLVQGEALTRVTNQSTQLQYSHYKVLREVVFPNYDLALKGRLRGLEKMLFYNQPVVQLSSFLSHNNKLTTINSFLENLIQLQVLLLDLFRKDKEPLELPYLDYLKRSLPDSRFYDLVQEKINFILNEGKPLSEESEEEETPQVTSDERQIEVAEGIDKIVIKDNVIRVPISFKTVNLQRRASIMEKGDTEEEKEPLPEPQLVLPIIPPNPTLKGKKIVIVPHKILTKPFTKLSLKEYLHFVLIVVKIFMNFRAFFKHIKESAPSQKLKRQTSTGTLPSTFRQLRGTAFGSTFLDSADDEYDFEKILAKIADLDLYFRQRSEQRPSSSSLTMSTMASSNLTGSALSSTEMESEISASLIHITSSQISTDNKLSRLRTMYENIFHRKTKELPSDENIYGIVSETHSMPYGSEILSHNREKGFGVASVTNKSIAEPKEIMETVHRLIANGSGGSRGHSMKGAGVSDEAVKMATLSMMAQSNAQLDEWDVVSKMY